MIAPSLFRPVVENSGEFFSWLVALIQVLFGSNATLR